MKRNEKLWFFESYEEISAYMAKEFPANVFLAKRRCTVIRGDMVVHPRNIHNYDRNGEDMPEWDIKEGHLEDPFFFTDPIVVGHVRDFAPEEYATKRNFKSYDFSDHSLIEAFYKAGEHLAARLTVDDDEKKLTAAEMAKDVTKGGPALNWPEDEQEVIYCVSTDTGQYKMDERMLFEMIDKMEKVEGVTPAKRRRFTIKSKDKKERKVVARLQFDADKVLPKLKNCWAKDVLRPMLNFPAIELKTGMIVASNGHVLAAHKLNGYKVEMLGTPIFQDVNLPREITQMKGVITVEIEEKKFEHSKTEHDKTTTWTVDGLMITAHDEKGKWCGVGQESRYPNWRSVFPQRVGKPIGVDVKAWTEGVKQVLPHVSGANQLMWMDGEKGSNTIAFKGEDYDFSKKISVDVPAPTGTGKGIWVGLKAPAVLDMLSFNPDKMYYTDPTRALLFESSDTILICMPMLLNDRPDSVRGPRNDHDYMKFSIDEWVGSEAAPKVKAKPAVKAKAVKTAKVVAQVSKTEPTLEDRLRDALKKQLLVAA